MKAELAATRVETTSADATDEVAAIKTETLKVVKVIDMDTKKTDTTSVKTQD